MAKAKIRTTCVVCGKEFTHEVQKYSRRDANSWEQWAADKEWTCSACLQVQHEAAQQAKRQAENEAAATRTKEKNLPELQGSEKQIAWANTIRLTMIDEIAFLLKGIRLDIDVDNPEWREAQVQRVMANSGRTDHDELLRTLDDTLQTIKRLALTRDHLQASTSARWFIDHRDKRVEELWKSIAE